MFLEHRITTVDCEDGYLPAVTHYALLPNGLRVQYELDDTETYILQAEAFEINSRGNGSSWWSGDDHIWKSIGWWDAIEEVRIGTEFVDTTVHNLTMHTVGLITSDEFLAATQRAVNLVQ